MRVLIITLLFITFLQAALLPVNLVFIILICRSFVVEEKANYWLAFFFGLLLSLLLGYPIGSLSIIFLTMIAVVHLIKKVPISSSWLVILPLATILLIVTHYIESFLLKFSVQPIFVVIEIILIIPIYFIVRFWEERFIPTSDIRLKMRK